MWCTKVMLFLLFCGCTGSGSLSNPVTINQENTSSASCTPSWTEALQDFFVHSCVGQSRHTREMSTPSPALRGCLRDYLVLLMAQ